MKFKTQSLRLTIALSSLALLITFFQNCGEGPGFKPYLSKNALEYSSTGGSPQVGGSVPGSGVDNVGNDESPPTLEAFKATLEPVLKNNCTACHSFNVQPLIASINSVTSHDTLIFFGYVDPDVPNNSSVVQVIRNGHQGIPVTVADQIRNQITAWRDRERTLAAQAGLPSRFGDRTADNLAVLPTYTSIANKILIPKCVSCHGAVTAMGGKRFDTYAATMTSVVSRSPNTSRLYVTTQSGSMPQAPRPRLTADELSAIFIWISNGAMNN